MDTATQQQGQPQAPAPARRARPRRSIEDEIAALEARKAALLAKQRKMQAREKIILGALAVGLYRDSQPQARQIMRQWYITHAAERDREIVRQMFDRLDTEIVG